MAIWDRLTSFIAGGAVARAASEGVTPVLEPVRQHAWQRNKLRVVDPNTAARMVTQGLITETEAKDEAGREGYNANRLNAMIQLAYTVPGVAELMFLWRYDLLTEKQWEKAVQKTGIRPDFIPILRGTFSLPLDQGAISTAVHRGIMKGDGLLLREPPVEPGKVPAVPPSKLDPVKQAQAQGISREQLRILVGNTGLPLSLGEMLQLLNRKVVEKQDVQRSIAESNVRNEYMDVALALARQLLTPHEYAEAELRGVKSHTDAKAGAALHGLNSEDYDTLFAILGRPLSVHQLTTGIARGGKFGGTYDDVPEPYRDAIRRSAVRPEYASLDYANRYTYPSAFVLRSMAQAGELGDAKAVAKVLEEIGWPPPFAEATAKAWVGPSATADPHAKKAQTQLWTKTHSSYVAEEIGAAAATGALTAAGVDLTAIPEVLKLWNEERGLVRKQLSASQVVKALYDGLPNPDTGQPWTQQDVITALIDRGYSQSDALTLIQEKIPPPPNQPLPPPPDKPLPGGP